VKANPYVATIPVIVVTGSETESDVESSYKLMANSYLRKPANWDEFEQMVISLNSFWFTRVKLPKLP
jgi:chemotaxis family two-component system response regulator Rcp1